MAKLSKWLLTDGYTIDDPSIDYYQKDFSAKVIEPKQERIEPSSIAITLKVHVDPSNNSKGIGGDCVLASIKNQLIVELYKRWENKSAVARALGISVRTVWTVIDGNIST